MNGRAIFQVTSEPIVEPTIDTLEQLFADPWDSTNPCGFDAILEADERGEMLEAGELLLDRIGFAAEFVPVSLGGRLSQLTRLIEFGRAVFRRDPCLGLGYGASSLIAAVNVWSAGSQDQQRKAADLLLGNRKLACAYNELEHGNDLARAEFEALPYGEQLMLNGGKQVIANIERADALILYARTDTNTGSRSHSQLLLEKTALMPDCVRYQGRYTSVGMRGVRLGGIDIRDCPVSRDSILGPPGQGLETAMKAFQVTRVALPGMFMGILDTGLRSTVKYTLKRQLYGRKILDIPQTRAVLVGAFADLLLCDCFSTVVARSMHLTPNFGSVYSAAVKYLIPKLLIDAMANLSSILGAQFYLRNGENALFQKLLRDLKPAGFGHAAPVTCHMTILPQLPQLARRAWLQNPAITVPSALFDVEQELPRFSFESLRLGVSGQDPLAAALVATCSALHAHGNQPKLAALAQRFVDELTQLKQRCADLHPHELGAMAGVQSYALSARYVSVLAASACLNLWSQEQARTGDAIDPFLLDSRWLELVLQRLVSRLDHVTPSVSEQLGAPMLAELLHRQQHSQSFDLNRRVLFGAETLSPISR